MRKFLLVATLLLSCVTSFAQTVLILGDSLTEGYGIDPDKAYPYLVEAQLKSEGYPKLKIVNGGISGSTTASAAPRLKWFLKSKPDIMLLALGANDGLRGLKIEQTKKNLAQAITDAQSQGVKVILAGMKLPFNYGEAYRKDFENMYRALAKEHKAPLIPFLLEGVAGENQYNQADGIHPNEEGHRIMAKLVSKHLKEHL